MANFNNVVSSQHSLYRLGVAPAGKYFIPACSIVPLTIERRDFDDPPSPDTIFTLMLHSYAGGLASCKRPFKLPEGSEVWFVRSQGDYLIAHTTEFNTMILFPRHRQDKDGWQFDGFGVLHQNVRLVKDDGTPGYRDLAIRYMNGVINLV